MLSIVDPECSLSKKMADQGLEPFSRPRSPVPYLRCRVHHSVEEHVSERDERDNINGGLDRMVGSCHEHLAFHLRPGRTGDSRRAP